MRILCHKKSSETDLLHVEEPSPIRQLRYNTPNYRPKNKRYSKGYPNQGAHEASPICRSNFNESNLGETIQARRPYSLKSAADNTWPVSY